MYDLLGFSLALAALLTTNALATLAVAGVWRSARGHAAHRLSASAHASLLFTLRVLPSLLALALVAVLVVPSYLIHEPPHTSESVGGKLALLAAFSMVGLALALGRGVAAWLATRRLVKDWLRAAERIELDSISVPAYRLRHRFPVIAVVGSLRPRLFVAAHLFDELSADEMRAAVAHEVGHLAARDNLKRAALRACRDVLMIVPTGRALDRAWAECAEAAADEHVARGGGASVALDLASALVKIARLVPAGAKPTLPAGAFLTGANMFTNGGVIGWRVRRLTEFAARDEATWSQPDERAAWRCACAFSLCTSVAFVAYVALNPRVLYLIHSALEHAVRALE